MFRCRRSTSPTPNIPRRGSCSGYEAVRCSWSVRQPSARLRARRGQRGRMWRGSASGSTGCRLRSSSRRARSAPSTPAAVAERLDDRFRLLRSRRSGVADAPALSGRRCGGSRPAVPDERLLLPTAGIFAGASSSSPPSRVCPCGWPQRGGRRGRLARLVEKPLVSARERTSVDAGTGSSTPPFFTRGKARRGGRGREARRAAPGGRSFCAVRAARRAPRWTETPRKCGRRSTHFSRPPTRRRAPAPRPRSRRSGCAGSSCARRCRGSRRRSPSRRRATSALAGPARRGGIEFRSAPVATGRWRWRSRVTRSRSEIGDPHAEWRPLRHGGVRWRPMRPT